MKQELVRAPSLRESDGSSSSLTVEWLSKNRPPQCAPNPDYLTGCMSDMCARPESPMDGASAPTKLRWGEEFPVTDEPTCVVDIPYPAECCGVWIVRCAVCGWSIGLTAAGRVDDVRRVRLPCRLEGAA